MKTLKKQFIYENTVIMIMSDNGRPFPHSKTLLNDQGVKTPFVFIYKNGKVIGETKSLEFRGASIVRIPACDYGISTWAT